MRFTLFLLLLAGCSSSHGSVDGAVSDAPGILDPCMSGSSNRDCGWEVVDHRSCTPGAAVEIGCGAMCGLGTCTGDPMIRVCPGEAECANATALDSDDDMCGMLCPLVSFTCPPGGRYTVLTGAWAGTSLDYTCDLTVR